MIKTCSKCGFTGDESLFRKARNTCKKCTAAYHKNYKNEHHEHYLEYWNQYNAEHREERIQYFKNRFQNNKEKLRAQHRAYYWKNVEARKAYRSAWNKTSKGRAWDKQHAAERREFGYYPINKLFKSAHFHHMHLNGDSAIGIHIPKKLHMSIWHNSKTKEGMREINKAALLWLCDQSII